MPNNETHCFAIRRLCPFQGCLQVIEAGDAQTSSSNGLDWRIQVKLQTSLEQCDSMDGSQADNQVILFGFWSSEGGFHRVPLPPQISSRQIEIAAQPIIDVLLEQTHNVPFVQRDNCELWLLDEQQLKPLVLIASNHDPTQLPPVRQPDWLPTLLSDHSFTRNDGEASDVDVANASRLALDELIKHTAGQTPKAQWFQRQTDGSGNGLAGIQLAEDMLKRSLPKKDFPELLLREIWHDSKAQQLVQDYICWQAPLLLTLSSLSHPTRKRIEQLAFKQAFKIENQYKLYPEIIDTQQLKAVLIEAQMQRNNPRAGEKD